MNWNEQLKKQIFTTTSEYVTTHHYVLLLFNNREGEKKLKRNSKIFNKSYIPKLQNEHLSSKVFGQGLKLKCLGVPTGPEA